ncbi:hypothetical protein BH11ARM2_BH11ARM2_03290 [soil metagenome]
MSTNSNTGAREPTGYLAFIACASGGIVLDPTYQGPSKENQALTNPFIGYKEAVLGNLALLLMLTRPDVTGVVTENGKPLGGAMVFLHTAAPRKGFGLFCTSCYLDCGKRATTDAQGRFRLSSVDPTLIFRALVVKEGYQAQFVSGVDPMAKSDIAVDLKPRKKGGRVFLIGGRITDTGGNPIEGAILAPEGWKTETSYYFSDIDHVEPIVVSDAQGRFVFHSTKNDGTLLLKVDARGFAPLKAPGLTVGKENKIVVRDGTTLQGTVRTAEGDPVGGVLVQVVPRNHEASVFQGVMTIGTDEKGRFLLPNVPANIEVDVYSLMEGFAAQKRAVRKVMVPTGADGSTSEAISLVADHAVTVIGKVVTTDGKPLPTGIGVMIFRANSWDAQQGVVDKNGVFTFKGVPPREPLNVTLRATGYVLSKKTMNFQGEEPYRRIAFTTPETGDSYEVKLLISSAKDR